MSALAARTDGNGRLQLGSPCRLRRNRRACTGGGSLLHEPPGSRAVHAWQDLPIASAAAANGLPLYTRKPSDFDALKRILKVISI